MFGSSRISQAKSVVILTVLVAAGLTLFFIVSASEVSSQTEGGTQFGSSDPSQRRLADIRGQRNRLEQNLRDQQTRTSKLLDAEKTLLAQEAQLQREMGQVERELKLPNLPAEYQTKNCKLAELQGKIQQTREQIASERQEIVQSQQITNRIQGQVSQLQQQIFQTQQEVNGQNEPPPQARQQQTTSSADPMEGRMTVSANPLSGLSPNLATITSQGPGVDIGGDSIIDRVLASPTISSTSPGAYSNTGSTSVPAVSHTCLKEHAHIIVEFDYAFDAAPTGGGGADYWNVQVTDAIAAAGAGNYVIINYPSGQPASGHLTFTLNLHSPGTPGDQSDFISANADPSELIITALATGTTTLTITHVVIHFTSNGHRQCH